MIENVGRSMGNAVVRVALLLAIATSALAASLNDRQSLERGAVADLTPQEKYQTAIREAGGAYKAAQCECAQTVGGDRACAREARVTYENDMADARRILGGREPPPSAVR